ncbi:hypothetical protein GF325_06885 [Candidatus Bathyarchaeota archaeon]|nr:hypothetical protein [Candidatus Bathyarchaeota archaeon]
MGFKRISQKQLETSLFPMFIGPPIRHIEDIKEIKTGATKTEKKVLTKASDVILEEIETLDYEFDKKGALKGFSGNGIVNVINSSSKDRLWDVNLHFSENKNINLDTTEKVRLGNFEPKTNKKINYNLLKSNEISTPLTVVQYIDVQQIDLQVLSDDPPADGAGTEIPVENESSESQQDGSENQGTHGKSREPLIADSTKKLGKVQDAIGRKKRQANLKEGKNILLLLLEKRNLVDFKISFENNTDEDITEIKVGKSFPADFYNIRWDSETISSIELKEKVLYLFIEKLAPGETAAITIHAEVYPRERKIIGTGSMQVSYLHENCLLSGLSLEKFSGYSHAMHAMKVKERETKPNVWNCSVLFRNNCNYNMKIKSMMVLDKEKKTSFLNEKYEDGDAVIVSPNETYTSREWEVSSKEEPKFYRKIIYSITSTQERKTQVNMQFEQDTFNIASIQLTKAFSKKEIKSFEISDIQNLVTIKNIGTIPVHGLIIHEEYPADFLPSLKEEKYKIRKNSGKITKDSTTVAVEPFNANHDMPHLVTISVNASKDAKKDLMDVNEFLEIRHEFKAMNPDYNNTYNFPLKIVVLYPFEMKGKDEKILYMIEEELSPEAMPILNVIHKRRNILVGKEIFAGRNIDEFGINLFVKNNSNVEIKDFKIEDTISTSFEILSSNVDYKIESMKSDKHQRILFLIDKILPNQEKEIRYYIKNKSGKVMDFDQLESFIYG